MDKKTVGIITPPRGLDPRLEARQLAQLDAILDQALALVGACDKWGSTVAKISDLSLTPGESRSPFIKPWVDTLRAAVAESLANSKRYGIGG